MTLEQLNEMDLRELVVVCLTDPEHIAIVDPHTATADADWLDEMATRESVRP